MEGGATYRNSLKSPVANMICLQNMKVLSNTGNYLDMSTRVAVVILDTDCEIGGGFGLNHSVKTDAWFSQTQNIVTCSYFLWNVFCSYVSTFSCLKLLFVELWYYLQGICGSIKCLKSLIFNFERSYILKWCLNHFDTQFKVAY